MDDYNQILKRLEEAIDSENMNQIGIELALLGQDPDNQIQSEDFDFFSTRIQKKYIKNKEKPRMKKSKKSIFTVAVVAMLVVSSITVYATGIWRNFSFVDKEGNYTSVRAGQSFTEKDKKSFIDSRIMPELTDEEQGEPFKQYFFDTIQEAEDGMDMIIPAPKDLKGFILDGTIQGDKGETDGAICKTVMLSFVNPDKQSISINVMQSIIPSDKELVFIQSAPINTQNKKIYKTPADIKYTIFSDFSENTTRHTAILELEEYQYVVMFDGSLDELESILNTIDVSMLR